MSNKRPIPKRWLGAFKAGHRASAREFIDEELSWKLLKKIEDSNYTDQESIKALDYITRFNNEFHKNVIKKDDPEALHNTEALRKDLYARENARNRDLMSKERKSIISMEPNAIENEDGNTSYSDSFINKNRNLSGHEDIVNELVDLSIEEQKNPKKH